MARRHIAFRQVMRRDPPNYVKAFLLRQRSTDTKKICDYCESHRLFRVANGTALPKVDEERTWHFRSTLVKLPNGLFICHRHEGPRVREFDALKRLIDD